MAARKVVKIDEELCDGCGDCVPACEEGAIQIIDGKARLVSDVYCDGLGACLGDCPQDAISIEEREADDFDEAAVAKHIAKLDSGPPAHAHPPAAECGCPGSAVRSLDPGPAPEGDRSGAESGPSMLRNWPVQIKLMPVRAPYLDGADLLIAADCVPFAYRGFHGRFLAGKTLLIGCPKLDDAEFYIDKLTQLFMHNDVKSVEIAIMEVPCCMGLEHIVTGALQAAGKSMPVTITVVGVRGEIKPTGQGLQQMLGQG
ncbi:MAG: 4Fe-4S binding protein [Deltaproteobacteria bacterium]|nr:4Fe-4S binding protein [Deltaproteobacteria bacterium]